MATIYSPMHMDSLVN